MMTALYIVLIVLSILGAYMAAILAVQSIMHKSFEGARSFVNELLKDVLYGRGSATYSDPARPPCQDAG